MKLAGWRTRLHRAIGVHKRAPFQWGVHDCGILVADAVIAQIGVDPADGLRGQYKTFAGARKRLKRIGYDDHVALIADRFREVPSSMAQFGDLVELDSSFGPALGVVMGAFICGYAVPAHDTPIEEARLSPLPFEIAVRAFRVG